MTCDFCVGWSSAQWEHFAKKCTYAERKRSRPSGSVPPAHSPCCERLFVTAGRSKKEISKTTVSFWLRKTISCACELSSTEQPVPAPRARETRGIALSLLLKKNAVDQVLKAGTTFTRHYLRDLAQRSIDTFYPGPVVAAQALV